MFDSLNGYEIQKIDKVVDFAFQTTPLCRVRNSSYEFAVISKNKILRDFWETQSLKNGLNRRFWKKIASLWLRHFRFESLLRAKRVTRLSGPIQNLWFCKWVMFLLRVYNAIKPVKTFCQVFKVEICKANTTVTWQVVIPKPIPRNNLFRGFFMPEYRFLWQHSGIFSLLQNIVRVFERF